MHGKHSMIMKGDETNSGMVQKRPFPHSTSVRTNNSTKEKLGWTFSYICCNFVHPDLDSVPLFVVMRERSIC